MEGVTIHRLGNTLVADIDSLTALHAFAQQPANFERNKYIWGENNTHRWAQSIGAERYYGCSVAKVDEVLRTNSWPEGAKRVMEAMDELQACDAPRSVRRTVRWADQGDSLDIHRVYSGQLDQAWRKVGPRRRVATRNISLFVNITINAGTDHSVMFWTGAAVLKLADMLTNAGYNVEIVVIETGGDCTIGHNVFEGGTIRHTVINTLVKAASAPLDVDSLAVSMCFPAFLRHLMFKAECALPVHTNLGRAATYRSIVSQELDSRNIILCEGMRSAHDAMRWVNEQVETVELGEQAA